MEAGKSYRAISYSYLLVAIKLATVYITSEYPNAYLVLRFAVDRNP
jgi:hypothetical protein